MAEQRPAAAAVVPVRAGIPADLRAQAAAQMTAKYQTGNRLLTCARAFSLQGMAATNCVMSPLADSMAVPVPNWLTSASLEDC